MTISLFANQSSDLFTDSEGSEEEGWVSKALESGRVSVTKPSSLCSTSLSSSSFGSSIPSSTLSSTPVKSPSSSFSFSPSFSTTTSSSSLSSSSSSSPLANMSLISLLGVDNSRAPTNATGVISLSGSIVLESIDDPPSPPSPPSSEPIGLRLSPSSPSSTPLSSTAKSISSSDAPSDRVLGGIRPSSASFTPWSTETLLSSASLPSS
mmetsp:Transcript_21120/g.44062  ORF Transcript_21120/g.44062 Transcript_21120/m.44062 type:complete len:208 (+) Transcript_21120:1487-2110(+)